MCSRRQIWDELRCKCMPTVTPLMNTNNLAFIWCWCLLKNDGQKNNYFTVVTFPICLPFVFWSFVSVLDFSVRFLQLGSFSWLSALQAVLVLVRGKNSFQCALQDACIIVGLDFCRVHLVFKLACYISLLSEPEMLTLKLSTAGY